MRVFRATPMGANEGSVAPQDRAAVVLDSPAGDGHMVRWTQRVVRDGALGALLAIAALLVWRQLRGDGASADGRGPSYLRVVPPGPAMTATSMPEPTRPEATEPPGRDPRPPRRTTASTPHLIPLARATVTAEASVSAPPVECTGRVHISSTGSWNVSGGPTSVQSPGWYTWRCGSFGLMARSRVDPAQVKTANVVVRADRSAEVDLR